MSQNTGQIFYVSPTGSDAWSGTRPLANPDHNDGPFATLQHTRDAVRSLKKSAGENSGPVTVILRGGTYTLQNTLVLTAEDGGTQQSPVTWCAYPGENPILSGGQGVTGWRPYQGSILQADFPAARARRGQNRQLFYLGQRQQRARWPKFDAAEPIRGGWAFPEGSVPDFGLRAFRFKPGTFPRPWSKPYEGEVRIVIGHGWNVNLVPIRSIDFDQRILWLDHNTMEIDLPPWFMKISLNENSRFCIENILEELSQPGEWCCDASAGLLYFWSPDDHVADGDVIIPALDCLLRLQDTQWIRISGLTFTHTTTGDDYHRNRLEGYGAMFPQSGWSYCGETLHMRATSHCTVEKCYFDQVGGNAIYLERDNFRNQIQRNEIAYAGANGVVLIGDRAFHPLFNEVVDNHIHHAGAIINYVAGVFLGASDGNLVAHNSIHDMPHHAINLGANGMGRNYIEYNEIRRVCLEIADTGAINCWMDVPGSWIDAYAERSGHVIRNNLIVDVPGCVVENGQIIPDRTTRGIYLDDCTSNCVVTGNIIVRTGMGFMVHGGKHNLIENNIIIDCRMGLHGDDWPPDRPGNAHIKGMWRGNRFVCNIVYSTLSEAYPYFFWRWNEKIMERCDNNVFYLPNTGDYRVPWINPPDNPDKILFSHWQAFGFDHHSLIADPQFIDLPGEDFRLQPTSPALQLGFQPVDLSAAGIRPDADAEKHFAEDLF